MIQYALKCDKKHSFDSWFQSAAAFDKLQEAKLLTCSVCGSSDVFKSVMAPRVSTGVDKKGPLSAPASPAEQAFAELRKKIEANSDYVGPDFVKEARAMHHGLAPERSIYGEARIADAKKLIEDGVPVMPLPFSPLRKVN
jgi:hypothetical protein